MKRLFVTVAGAVVLMAAVVAGRTGGQAPSTDRLTTDVFKAMTLRNIGPALVTGRVVDIEIDPKNSNIWYVASAFGGLWKTENKGQTFKPIFDQDDAAFTLCCVVVDPKDSNVVWLGSGENNSQRSAHFGSGLYKSTDAGATWKKVGLENSEHIGKILIDPRNSNTVWVAAQGPLFTEEGGGDRGLFKTTDGGATWVKSLNINETTGVSDIVFDPKNPDVLFAGTYQRMRHVGQMIGGGPDGGIFQTKDGGKNWKKLSVGLPTPTSEVGRIALAVDPRVDPKKPSRFYAFIDGKSAGGGRGAGRAGGGGAGAAGAGAGGAGAAGAGAAATPPQRGGGAAGAGAAGAGAGGAAAVPPQRGGGGQGRAGGGAGGGNAAPQPYIQPPAPTESDNAGFYRSDDGGVTWSRISMGGGSGGAYYCEIFVDPRDPEVIWSADTNWSWSKDGGKTWSNIGLENSTGRGNMAVHVDHHVVEFDWSDKNHIIIGNDGGVYDTYDNGKSWAFHANLPITQFYRVGIGNELPFYTVCGGTQDNFSICGPSRTSNGVGTRTSDWYLVQGGDGFQAWPDYGDPNIVYGQSQEGGLGRFDRRTGRTTSIRPTGGGGGRAGAAAGGAVADRTNWDAPYMLSPHNHNRLYWGSQFLYRTDDQGDNWRKISPDLTRNLDWQTLPIMGKVWPAGSINLHSSTTALSNIVTIDESPLLEGLLIVGTDDGLVQISEDGGKNWHKSEDFPGVPKWTYVTDVAASPRDSNVFFATLNNWQRGDYKPYVVKSVDRGKTWTNITGNLPAKHDTWAIEQDHVNPDLLFVGTEYALFFTVDSGQHWVSLKGNAPPMQIRDLHLQRRDNDVVMATFGRGFWILDDYSALREVNATTLAEDARLFPLRDAYQFGAWGLAPDGSAGLSALGGNYTFQNPPIGAVFTYNVGQTLPDNTSLVLDIKDGAGRQVRRVPLGKDIGLRRVVWNFQADTAGGGGGRAGGAGAGGGGGGGRAGGGAAQAEPGRYFAQLAKVVGETATPFGPVQTFQVVPLPERNYSLYR